MIIKRDISVYIFTTLVVILYGWIGKITWISSVILLFIYSCQVMLVLWQDRKRSFGGVTQEEMRFELLRNDTLETED